MTQLQVNAFDFDAPAPAGEAPRVCLVGERPIAELDARLIEEWQALAQEAAEPNSFQEPWFAAPALRHLAGEADLRLLEVREDSGRLIGMLPLSVRDRLGRVPFRNVQNWRHDLDFLGTPLVRQGRERDFWTAVLDWLDAASWAPGFLHVSGLVEDGLVHSGLAAAAAARGRTTPVVHRAVRAALISDLPPEEYYQATVRKKKRKELARLANRLAEQGALSSRTLEPGEDSRAWCEDFLALERGGWKGREGTALACRPETERFFREAVAGAEAASRLQMRRIDLNGEAIAMLVNFLAPPGSFSFKIAYDERYARFSPGVLLEFDNFGILSRPDIEWMDSCAAENHPMIDRLWGERRSIVRVSVRLAGVRRTLVYAACRSAETASATVRRTLRRIR